MLWDFLVKLGQTQGILPESFTKLDELLRNALELNLNQK